MERTLCSDGRRAVVMNASGLSVWDEGAKRTATAQSKFSALIATWPWDDICGAKGEVISKTSSELHVYLCSRGRPVFAACGGTTSAPPVTKVAVEYIRFGPAMDANVLDVAENIRRLACPAAGSDMLLITNPRSGARQASGFARLLTPIFLAAGFSVASVTTNHAGHMRELGAGIVERHLASLTVAMGAAASACAVSESTAVACAAAAPSSADEADTRSSAASSVAVDVSAGSRKEAVSPSPINVVVLGGDGTVTEFLQGILDRCGCGRLAPSQAAASAALSSGSSSSSSSSGLSGAVASSPPVGAVDSASAVAVLGGPRLLAAVLARLRIAAVPCGTQNALARGLRTLTPLRTAMCVVKQSLRPLDALLAVNGNGEVRIGVCGFAWGVPGAIAAGSEGYRWLGTKRYALLKAQHGLSGGLGFRRYEATVTWRDEPALTLPRATATTTATTVMAAAGDAASISDDAAMDGSAGRGTPTGHFSDAGPSWAAYKHCRPGCSQCAITTFAGDAVRMIDTSDVRSVSSSSIGPSAGAERTASGAGGAGAAASRPAGVRLEVDGADAAARRSQQQTVARMQQVASLGLLEQLLLGNPSPSTSASTSSLPPAAASASAAPGVEAPPPAIRLPVIDEADALSPSASGSTVKMAGTVASSSSSSTSPTAATPLLRSRGAAATAASSASSSSAFAMAAPSAASILGSEAPKTSDAGGAGSGVASGAVSGGATGGSTVAGRVIAVGFVNTSPDARFSHAGDGRLDVIVARRGGLAASAGLLARYVGRAAGIGDELHSPLLRYAKARSATLMPAPGCEALPANLDGEAWGPGPFAVTLLPCLLTAFGEP